MRRTIGTLMAVGGLAAMVGPVPAAAAAVEGVHALMVEAYVIEQQCFGEDDFVDVSAVTNLPGAAVQ
jgi:hypothetical protein